MQLIDLDTLRTHCRADSDDDALLTVYGNAAEKAVQRLANRAIFATEDERETAIQLLPAQVAAARAAYKADMDAAAALADDVERSFAEGTALNALNRVLNESHHTLDAILVDDDIKAAILMIAANFYRHREEDTTVNGAVQSIPFGAQRIMAWYTKVAL